MKRLYQYWKNKIYFIPALYSLIALLISLLVFLLHDLLTSPLATELFPFLFQSVGSARDILAVLTGALLSMITVSFSTIMVVLTLYSAQFSPRTLQVFLESKTSLRVLGFFMGTFIYSVTQLFLLPEDANLLTLAGTIGTLLAIFCLTLFAFFIHHVARSIQVDLMVEHITKDIFIWIEKKELRRYHAKAKQVSQVVPDDYEDKTLGKPNPILAQNIGYLQSIDNNALIGLASEYDFTLRLEQSLGDYVTKEIQLFSFWGGPFDQEEELMEKIHKALVIGEERQSQEDVEYGLIKLVEVALRAISPGINDPNTAILCIGKIGYVLAEIAQAKLHKTYYYDEENKLRLIINKIPFEELLYNSFSQIKVYAQHDYSVLAACVDALNFIARKGNRHIKELCWSFSLYLFEGKDIHDIPSLDHRHLGKKMEELAFVSNHLQDNPFDK